MFKWHQVEDEIEELRAAKIEQHYQIECLKIAVESLQHRMALVFDYLDVEIQSEVIKLIKKSESE